MTATTQQFQVSLAGDLAAVVDQSVEVSSYFRGSITLSSPLDLPGTERRGPGRPRVYPARPPASYFRGFPGGRAKPAGGVSRVWESVSASKAKAYYPDLDPGFLENKFRWGAFKAFAASKGGPVDETTYPVAAANGMQWLVEKNYAKLVDGKLVLRKKGLDLYNILFKARGPRDFAPTP